MNDKLPVNTSRFTEVQIIGVLGLTEGGISSATFYKWLAKFGGMDASIMSQMKALEYENRRLKSMFTDLSMQADLMRGALGQS